MRVFPRYTSLLLHLFQHSLVSLRNNISTQRAGRASLRDIIGPRWSRFQSLVYQQVPLWIHTLMSKGTSVGQAYEA